MHESQIKFCLCVRDAVPEAFRQKRVLDVGSYDVNGNNRFLFSDCIYTGVDVVGGPNVDVVLRADELAKPDGYYDTIISTSAFEHDKYLHGTLENIVRMLRRGGLLMFTAAGVGWPEHGTRTNRPIDSPSCQLPGWEDYYCPVTPEIIKSFIPVREIFCRFCLFECNSEQGGETWFWGLKRE